MGRRGRTLRSTCGIVGCIVAALTMIGAPGVPGCAAGWTKRTLLGSLTCTLPLTVRSAIIFGTCGTGWPSGRGGGAVLASSAKRKKQQLIIRCFRKH